MTRTWLITLATIFFLVGCTAPAPQPTPAPIATPTVLRTPTPTFSPTVVPTLPSTPTLVSINEILKNPATFRDKRVRVQGYGFTMATVPLCAGYVGLDRRTLFIDAQRNQITADVRWKPPAGARMYDPDNVRVFEGYVRIFSGEIGCPGSIKVETFPYFEVVEVY